MGFNEVLLSILYPLLNLYLRWEPPRHSLKRIPVPTTEPFVGTGEDPGFTPRVHQQALAIGPFDNTCEVDAVSPEETYEGLQDGDVYNQGNIKGILYNNNQYSYITYQRDLLCIAIDLNLT
jgi:hypothetical protein